MSAFKPDFAKPDLQSDFAGAQLRLSPNCGDRRNRRKPDMLILHYTGMATAQEALDWLCVEESQVSSHYFVDEAGLITQMVPESLRAWHAGESNWKGETDANSASIGIEIAHVGHREDDAGLPGCADRCGDQAVPRHCLAQRYSQPNGFWRIPILPRCASRIPARCFPGTGSTRRHRPLGRAAAGRRRALFPGGRFRPARGSVADHACALRLRSGG
jgi:hypothetical protein